MPGWAGGLIGGSVAVVLAALGWRFGIGVSIIILAALALLTVIGMSFRAVQGLTEPDLDADVEDAPTPAEMQKRSALKALKDLEYERSIGNILDEDYRELEGRYREEAKRAMRAVDAEREGLRARAEELAQEALSAANEQPKPKKKKPNKVECPKCGTENDPDAKFCKECAVKLREEDDAEVAG
ncbi:MAG: zinc ribbon domain-containing protein [Polyangiales bacterium]